MSGRAAQSKTAPSDRMLETAQQIWALARQRKKIFLIPLVAVLAVIGGLLVVAQGSVVAPFIYALF
jgi:hypothetical protein